MIKGGISQIGGKYRLYKELLKRTPYHEFFLSPFCGACWFELNKPRCRYECFNDLNSELINYFIQIRKHPKEFDEMKQGIFGLVSQEICNRIVRGDIKPKDDLERAYFYYYLNKLTFGGGIWMVRKDPPFKGIDPADQAGKYDKQYETSGGRVGIVSSKRGDKGIKEAKENYAYKTSGGQHGIISRTGGFMNRDTDVEKAKQEYELKTKGYAGLNQNRAIPQSTFHKKDIDDIKANYRGLVGMGVVTEINRDLKKKEKRANYSGLNTGAVMKKGYTGFKQPNKSGGYKGINSKTTRPFTKNDLGLLSPLDPECIKRLRYVNLTSYDFRKVYTLFYNAFHVRKGLGPECFLYVDSPYCGTETYYKSGFDDTAHLDLVELLLDSPFHILQTIGGNCKIYIDLYKEAGWFIDELKTRYSTDANSQNEVTEFACMNYDISKLPLMTRSIEQNMITDYL